MLKRVKKLKALVSTISAWAMLQVFCLAANAEGTDTNVANAAGFGYVKGLLQSALYLLGGGLIIFGIVNFGPAWQSEDSEKKTKGIQSMIAGAIVVVAATPVTVFMTGSPIAGGET
jgi:zinc transporter ZupT